MLCENHIAKVAILICKEISSRLSVVLLESDDQFTLRLLIARGFGHAVTTYT
jgi:hypothetical protein